MSADQDLRRYREVFERIPVGIYRTTSDGRFLHANPELVTLLGYDSYEQLAEVNTKDLYFDPNDRLLWREIMERDGVITDHDTRKLRRDGTVLWLRDSARCVRDELGAVLYYEGAVVDVTEAHRMAKQLAHSERMASVGLLAAGVAHEINNPLAYVLTNVEFSVDEMRKVLRAGVGDGEAETLVEVIRALGEAADGVERLRGIVAQLSSFARDGDDVAAHADIGDVIGTAVRMVQNELRHCATLHVDVPPLPLVAGNPAKLVQVFVNLLINAAQAFAGRPVRLNEVRVCGRHADADEVVITVSDTAGGIAPDGLRRLFEPFYTTKPGTAGTGLGLTLSQNTVVAAGGTIDVESQLDVGTTFAVTLPVSQRVEPSVPPQRHPSPLPLQRKPRVLIVDDEPLIGRSLRRVLQSDFDVSVVTSAKLALEMLAGDDWFDAILCDVMMPEMSGIELHQRLLETSPSQTKRLAFITGGAFGTAASQYLEAENVPTLIKPITSRQIRALLRDLARQGSGNTDSSMAGT